MSGDQQNRTPRRLIHKSQARAVKWLHQYRRARSGLPQTPDKERAKRELHSAMMLYYEQIARFQHDANIADLWEQLVLWDGVSLQQVGERQLDEETRRYREYDADTNSEQTVSKPVPWVMEPDEALELKRALDRCAYELGFDAETERVSTTTGAGSAADEDETVDLAEMDYLQDPNEVVGDDGR